MRRDPSRPDDARVVHEDVDRPEVVAAAADGLIDLRRASHVRRDGDDLCPSGAAAGGRLLEVVARRHRVRAALDVAADVEQQQIGASLRKGLRCRPSDAAPRAGDEDRPRQPLPLPAEVGADEFVRDARSEAGSTRSSCSRDLGSIGSYLGAHMEVRKIRIDVRWEIEERIDAVERLLRAGFERLRPDEEELLAGEELEPALDLLCVPAAQEVRPAADRPAVVAGIATQTVALGLRADASSAATASANDSSGSSSSRRDIWNCEYARSTGLRNATISFTCGRVRAIREGAHSWEMYVGLASPVRNARSCVRRMRSDPALAGKCERYQSTPR